MQGIIQKLAGEFSDDALPRYYPEDTRLNKGSLVLYEPGHPANPFVGLANLSAIPNIAHVPANVLTGASQASLAARLFIGATATASSRALYERSSKGGIHGIVSQDKTKFTSLAANTQGAAVEFDFASHPVLAYMKANPTHLFYISSWGYVTRAGNEKDPAESVGIYPAVGATICGSNSYNDYFTIQDTKQNLPAADSLPSRISRMRPSPPNSLVTNAMPLGGIRRATSRIPAGTVANVNLAKAGSWGYLDNGVNNNPSAKPAFPSYIFYSLYIEDCNVSGRTLEQADAADLVEFIKQVETAGGRYYGDTFTSPSTIV